MSAEQIIKINVKNKNGRIYSRKVVEQIIDLINSNDHGTFGEISPQLTSFGNIDLNKVSHVVSNARINEDNWLIVDIRPLKTPMGNLLKKLQDDSPELGGFRPRGFGNIDKDGIVSEYQFITIDFVETPA